MIYYYVIVWHGTVRHGMPSLTENNIMSTTTSIAALIRAYVVRTYELCQSITTSTTTTTTLLIDTLLLYYYHYYYY